MSRFHELPDRKSIFEGSKMALGNAKDHFKAGEILSENNLYGLAIAHVILAAEEVSKSIVIYLKYNDSKIEQSLDWYDFDKIFHNHEPKQVIATILSFFGQLFSISNPYPFPLMDIFSLDEKEFSEKEIQIMHEKHDERMEKSIETLKAQLEPNSHSERVAKWWDTVNDRKNASLYVNLNKGQWETPQDNTLHEYQTACEYVSGLIDFFDKMVEIQEELNQMEAKP